MNEFNRPVTREEFVTMIVKLYEASGGGVIVPTTEKPFTDSGSMAISKAYELGFVAGTGNSSFNPLGLLTRQEAAVIMKREWQKLGLDSYIKVVGPMVFTDKGKIAEWAKEATQYMNQAGILMGTGQNVLNPQGSATREQAIALILRSFEKGQALTTNAV